MKTLILLVAVGVAAPATILPSPPSGRPPTGALARLEPKVYDLRYEVGLNTSIPFGVDDPRYRHPDDKNPIRWGGTFDVANSPIVMPVVFQSAFHQVAPDSVRAHLWLQAAEDPTLKDRFRVDPGAPHHSHLAVIPIERFVGKQFRWGIEYRMQSFSSRIDDAEAARVTWPREWPAEVTDGLKPQMYIESDDPIFAATVERVAGAQLRMVPPYYAAKDLVRYCVRELQVNGGGVRRGRLGILHGMEMVGARQAAREGLGSPHDLVCVCIAVLRAAGIPARPVVGVMEDDRGRSTFVSWGEFYLPDTGWVPFDPDVMRGKGMHRPVEQPWPEFGTMDQLNERVPLAYHFMPARAVESPMLPAVWGWDPRPNGAPAAEQLISITITSRGRGTEDAR